MKAKLLSILKSLDQKITEENRVRDADGIRKIQHLKIQILGQFALFLDEEANKKLDINATLDIDALLNGDVSGETLFKKLIIENGFVYDELSKEIWIPETAEFRDLLKTVNLSVSYCDPISVLTSKAVKAFAKNKLLILNAIDVFGEELTCSIDRFDINIKNIIK